jgi:hypothetical protein
MAYSKLKLNSKATKHLSVSDYSKQEMGQENVTKNELH